VYESDVAECDEASLAALLAANRERDLLLKSTARGPHRDDIDLTLDGRSSRDFGSEGQQRSLVLALRLAQLGHFRERSGVRPVVLADDVIDESGKVTQQGAQGGTEAGFKLNSADTKAGRLALYRCKVDGQTKYVIPVYGMGLWGPISGYIALNDDKATIYGAYFNHESETAGLGAEIKDNLKWQQ
jgi:hypothetical protein